jgi:radical SAM superfamily enzyme YgiQ (UPF0313 family)
MAKIILIIPKTETEISPLVYPPLGLLYIAAILENEGHDISIYDMRDDNKIENIPTAEFYGFTAVTPQIGAVIASAKYLREHTNSFLFIGGAHASYFPHELKKTFDAIIVGEGEELVCDIIKNRAEKIGCCAPTQPADLIPFPARHLMKVNKVVSSELWEGYGYGTGPKATTLITSRGCAWRCAFCANIPQKVRFRSVDNIINEIELVINKYDCRNFRFIDDNFITNKNRLKEFSKKAGSLNISFRCAGRTNLLTDKVCELLAQSGCKEIGFGIESADNKILSLLNKNETVENHKKAILMAKKHGLKTKGFFMAGLPGETWETIEKNKNFVEEVGLNKIIVTLFTPYPGCAMWEDPKKFDIKILENNWDKYFQTYPSKSAIESSLASNDELTAHFDEFINFTRSVKK